METTMKNLIIPAALSLFAITAANSAFADGHASAEDMTCAEFSALDRQEQSLAFAELTGEIDSVDRDDDSIETIMLQCNGNDEKMLSEVLETFPKSE
jgi:prepilin-type processing-associated H-X9-DG protein